MSDWLDKFPELANATVRFWTCPEHNNGTVVWLDDVAYCQQEMCGHTSATPDPFEVEIGELRLIRWEGEWALWCGCGDIIPIHEVVHEHCANCHMACEPYPQSTSTSAPTNG